MQTYYTYSPITKRLTRADDPADIDGALVVHPSREQYATIDAYPLADPMPPAPMPPEGKVAIPDGYELATNPSKGGSHWVRKYRYDDAPAPTVADFDAAMEEHLTVEREARGYTTREPSDYYNSSVPRWAQDARDWIAHRDAVLEYALTIMNAVERGEREPPTMVEFKTGLPVIEWSVE